MARSVKAMLQDMQITFLKTQLIADVQVVLRVHHVLWLAEQIILGKDGLRSGCVGSARQVGKAVFA
jgi:hypothetical protein